MNTLYDFYLRGLVASLADQSATLSVLRKMPQWSAFRNSWGCGDEREDARRVRAALAESRSSNAASAQPSRDDWILDTPLTSWPRGAGRKDTMIVFQFVKESDGQIWKQAMCWASEEGFTGRSNPEVVESVPQGAARLCLEGLEWEPCTEGETVVEAWIAGVDENGSASTQSVPK